ncbi:hypothetical protein A6R68_05283, partial [Neotoma lepida]
MDQELEQDQDSTEVSVEEGNDEAHQQSIGRRSRLQFLTTLPTALMKFVGFRKQRTSVSPNITTKLSAVKEKDSLEGPFGLGPLVFPFFQRFNNINFFLTLYCVVVLAQGLTFGLIDLSIGHFEKEFYLSKTEKVALSSTYDFTSLLVAIPVAYYGSRWQRPKWVAASAFLVGFGSILCAVPYMKYEIVTSIEKGEELCVEEEDRTMTECGETIVPHRTEIICLFILGQCLQGIAGMPIYILGVTFLYDHTATHSAGIYL